VLPAQPPVKQYVTEKVDEPLLLTVYPGADGSFSLYEDDGTSFNYRRGEWMGIEMRWNDAQRKLSLELAKGSRMLPPLKRALTVKVGEQIREVMFEGRAVEVRL
jgi:alpha-D-xyloside xylohydrolase